MSIFVWRELYQARVNQVSDLYRILKAVRAILVDVNGNIIVASDIAVDDPTRFTELRDARAKLEQSIAIIDEVTV